MKPNIEAVDGDVREANNNVLKAEVELSYIACAGLVTMKVVEPNAKCQGS